MGTDMDFKSFSSNNPQNGGGSKPLGNMSLARQQSIYSLTFDEFQSSMGGLGKDFGSMNMDELLKSIWSAEETQTLASASGIQEGTNGLQRQGSLTLPRTLSQKTVDEVWRDMSKEYAVGKDGAGTGGPSIPQRQQTLGEMTLEEFLVRAGVVREETQLAVNNGVFFGDLQHPGNNLGFGIGLQQGSRVPNLMGNRFTEGGNQIAIQSSNLPLNVNGVRLNQQPLVQQQNQQQQQQIYPKQPTVGYATQMNLQSGGQLGSPGIRGGIAGTGDQHQGINSGMIQGNALQGGGIGMVGLGGPLSVGTGSPASQISSDGIGKSSGDTSSVSPVPYAFNGGLRGRKSVVLEKAIERRQRRMIKNRESAARSRARKQAYTMELEAEVAKLKEENQELRKRQAEIMEMQKNQAMEMNMQPGGKKRCLRRTQTGPW